MSAPYCTCTRCRAAEFVSDFSCGHTFSGPLPHPTECPVCPKPLTFDAWWTNAQPLAWPFDFLSTDIRAVAKAAWEAARQGK